ncbi:DUF6493 family protein [Rhizohabitans arisaemae]|uniref:DUF7824 domain-containing protein n=1 Tax=Rhizohabitans arisaemae TaxID=2720610 RepID=UPI0024B26C1D|nr:DUF6493 family protein [Rhizohabitans arisaemae]
MTAWDDVRDLINRRRTAELAEYVTALGDEDRRRIARELPGHLAVLRDRAGRWGSLHEFGTALRVAGATTIGGAAAVAAWLNRREYTDRWTAQKPGEQELLLRVLATRPPDWQADLAGRLALRLRTPEGWGVKLAIELFRRTGAEPPQHDLFTVGWVSAVQPINTEITDDPFFTRMLPRIFEAEGVGRALQWQEDRDPWIARLIATASPARREMLLAGCVSRFLRGGAPADLRYFVRLHEALEPTAEQVAGRSRDYVRLLPAAPGKVAELALKHLRRLDEPDPFELTEALEGVLFRPERKLVDSGLTWLDRSVRRSPGLADEVTPALVPALGHNSPEVRDRAVRIALKLAPHLGPAGLDTIKQAVPVLPYESAEKLAPLLGGEVALPEPVQEPADPFDSLTLPEPPQAVPFPAPIESFEELIELTSWKDLEGWRSVERVLAAFVALAAADRETARTHLIRRLTHPRLYNSTFWGRWNNPALWVDALAREFGSPQSRVGQLPDPDLTPGNRWITLSRCAEIFHALRAGVLPPMLLATPTWSDGRLDAEEFLTRLETYEAAGATPMPADLAQALLRLPRDLDPEVLARTARLTSPEGRRVAALLTAGGVPVPTVTLGWAYRIGDRTEVLSDPAASLPEEARDARITVTVEYRPTGFPLIDRVLTGPRPDDVAQPSDLWPSVLPWHRELNAAYFTRFLSFTTTRWGFAGIGPEILHELAFGHGPAGEATMSLLAGCLLDSRPVGMPVVLGLAARGDLPAQALGNLLAQRVKHGGQSAVRVGIILREAATDGSLRQVWNAMEAALPILLPGKGEKTVRGLRSLLVDASAFACWAEARADIPALADFVARRKGNGQLIQEARKLHAYLTRP